LARDKKNHPPFDWLERLAHKVADLGAVVSIISLIFLGLLCFQHHIH
jgi:hypothetical protein